MSPIANYIEGKIEEFRIDGNSPLYLGLTEKAYSRLRKELLCMANVDSSDLFNLKEFLGLPVFIEARPDMPTDGVFIHATRQGI